MLQDRTEKNKAVYISAEQFLGPHYKCCDFARCEYIELGSKVSEAIDSCSFCLLAEKSSCMSVALGCVNPRLL